MIKIKKMMHYPHLKSQEPLVLGDCQECELGIILEGVDLIALVFRMLKNSASSLA